jgi:eukaryotic-like serine/threonine-protein kinase
MTSEHASLQPDQAGAPTRLEPGQVVAERYSVVRLLGDGAGGPVYLTNQVHTAEQLALKFLRAPALQGKDALERLRRESSTPARIGSEHVVRVSDVGTSAELGGAPFYAMEFLPGESLDKKLRSDGPLRPALALEYLRQVAVALDKAHAMGIVHGDLRPQSLFVTRRDDGSSCVKILGFGIGRLAAAEEGRTGVAAAELTTPEALRARDVSGPAADVWAFGLLAFRLLVARRYWAAETLPELHAEILSESPAPASARGSALGAPFDGWLSRCLAREPSKRFATAGEAVGALAEAIERGSAAAATAPVAAVAPDGDREKEKRRLMLVALIALAIGMALVTVVVLVTRGGSSPTPEASAATATASAESPPPQPVAETEPAPDPVESPAPGARPARDPGRKRVPKTVVNGDDRGLTWDQQSRLDAVRRLCDSGTITKGECAAKRQAILSEQP